MQTPKCRYLWLWHTNSITECGCKTEIISQRKSLCKDDRMSRSCSLELSLSCASCLCTDTVGSGQSVNSHGSYYTEASFWANVIGKGRKTYLDRYMHAKSVWTGAHTRAHVWFCTHKENRFQNDVTAPLQMSSRHAFFKPKTGII